MSAYDNKLIWENFFKTQKENEMNNYKGQCFGDLENIKDLIKEVESLDPRELEFIHKELSELTDKIKKFVDETLRPDVEFHKKENSSIDRDEF